MGGPFDVVAKAMPATIPPNNSGSVNSANIDLKKAYTEVQIIKSQPELNAEYSGFKLTNSEPKILQDDNGVLRETYYYQNPAMPNIIAAVSLPYPETLTNYESRLTYYDVTPAEDKNQPPDVTPRQVVTFTQGKPDDLSFTMTSQDISGNPPYIQEVAIPYNEGDVPDVSSLPERENINQNTFGQLGPTQKLVLAQNIEGGLTQLTFSETPDNPDNPITTVFVNPFKLPSERLSTEEPYYVAVYSQKEPKDPTKGYTADYKEYNEGSSPNDGKVLWKSGTILPGKTSAEHIYTSEIVINQ